MRFVIMSAACACVSVTVACFGGGASKTPTPAQSPIASVAAASTVAPTTPGATVVSTPPPSAGVASDGNAPGIPPLTGPIQQTPSGLRYIDEVIGSGATPAADATVTVNETTWLANGHKVESTFDRNRPYTFPLMQPALAGLAEGVSTMHIGGKRRLIVPPELGYGASPVPGAPGGTIPANSTLIIDVELLSVQ